MVDRINEHDEEFKGELSGNIIERAGTYMAVQNELAHDEHKKKSEKDADEIIKAIMNEAEKAHHALMDKINEELDKIRSEMTKNREKWEVRANRLNEIDDLFDDVKSGKELDTSKASQIIKKAGKDIPENATSADLLMVLNVIKAEDHEALDRLDKSYRHLEKGEDFYVGISNEADEIANDPNLDEDERKSKYAKLDKEVGNSNFLEEARNLENPEQQAEALAVAREGFGSEMQTDLSYSGGLDF